MTHDVGAQPSAEIADPHDHAVHVHLASDDEQARTVELDPCPGTPGPARAGAAAPSPPPRRSSSPDPTRATVEFVRPVPAAIPARDARPATARWRVTTARVLRDRKSVVEGKSGELGGGRI